MHIKEFFNSDFRDFSNLDNVRSIPSIIDGFKDSQRKAVYGMFCHGTSEIKVAQLAGSAALVSHYNHGEASMGSTIVGLAQNFPGSNNINLFEPIGQFGSILSSESSAVRYIYTKPSKWLRKLIVSDDDVILEHRYEDGEKAEPLNYYPSLPLWLINGCVGIGTGHSVKILPRDYTNVQEIIGKILRGQDIPDVKLKSLLTPSFEGWKGSVVEVEDGQFEMTGILNKVNTTTISITELPVVYGVDKFKEILVKLMDAGKVKDFDNNSTEEGFNFEVKVPREVGKMSEESLIQLFKLSTKVTENVTLWNTEGKLKRYGSVFEALKEFVEYRTQKFEERRLKHIEILSEDQRFLLSKQKFIDKWNQLSNPGKMSVSDISNEMITYGVEEEYLERLYSLRIASLSKDNIDLLQKDISRLVSKITELNKKTAKKMFLEQLA